MTNEEQEKCKRIIRNHAVMAGIGNALPVPGVDILVDITVLTTMTRALGNVFQQSLTVDYAKNIVIAVIKKQIAGRVIKAVVKVIPVLGWIAGPVIGVLMTEATGIELANRLDRRSF